MTDSILHEPVPIHGGAVTAILKLLEGQGLMTLATNSPEGQPHISTLGYVNDGLNLYFVTGLRSEKVRNMRADRRVAAAIRGRAEEGEALGVSIEGQVEEITDPEAIEALNRRVWERSPGQSPFAPGEDQTMVFRLTPALIKAVAVVDGRSRAQSFLIGPAELEADTVRYQPSAVARLF